LDDFRPVPACGTCQDSERNWTELATYAPRRRVEAQAVQLANRRTVALNDRLDEMTASRKKRCHSNELRFGAAHARWRDDLQHATWRSALCEDG
jgi:hypothetical protein